MICTVTFNPSLDYIVSVDDFQLGMTNRTIRADSSGRKGNQCLYRTEESGTGFHSPGICGGIHRRGTDPKIERIWRKC